MARKECDYCINHKTMYCPNSSECYSLDNLPNFRTNFDVLKENHTLNKGIDETIEEIEFEINNNFVVGGTYNRLNCLLQDLKKLKGE